jgi:hypothetical protein
MRLHVVSYDLNRPGQNYPALFARLAQLGAQRILYSQWMLKSALTASQLCDDLVRHIDPNDMILVIDASNSPMAWNKLKVEIKTTFNLT